MTLLIGFLIGCLFMYLLRKVINFMAKKVVSKDTPFKNKVLQKTLAEMDHDALKRFARAINTELERRKT